MGKYVYQENKKKKVTISEKKTKKDDMSSWVMEDFFLIDTLDGRNPAPVDMVNIPLFTGFYTSQVVQDFFHQQYNSFSLF